MRIAEITFVDGVALIKPLLGVNKSGYVISDVIKILKSGTIEELVKNGHLEPCQQDLQA